jgi:hypothetical protein
MQNPGMFEGILETDEVHNAFFLETSAGLLNPKAETDDRSGVLIMQADSLEFKSKALKLSKDYSDISNIVWDHQQSAVRFGLVSDRILSDDETMSGSYSISITSSNPMGLFLTRSDPHGAGHGFSAVVDKIGPEFEAEITAGAPTGQELTSLVQSGHLISAVNGTATLRMGYEEVIELLKATSVPVNITFKRLNALQPQGGLTLDQSGMYVTVQLKNSTKVEEDLHVRMSVAEKLYAERYGVQH